ncbi:MAG: hypothetical protein KJ950_04185 [Proteobacteria bacterium]|nr:hypothetical protein [Pseudomonadota bacterium]MBU1688464.1 hypothetical protein [Pseudomonadota bacterium]
MKMIRLICYISLFLVSSSVVYAKAVVDCFQCHEKSAFQGKVVHVPVAKGQCISCHNPHVARFEGLLQKQTSELCNMCHDKVISQEDQTKIHKPVREGNCLACHAPHASSAKGLLSEKHQGESCYNCHVDLVKKYEYPHEPYSKGHCNACHQPHQSDQYQLLVVVPEKLCEKCHAEDLSRSHKGYPGKKLRACLTCHSPHGSNKQGMIRDFLHAPYEEDCSNCHDGDTEVGTEKCFECHDEVRTELYGSLNHMIGNVINSCVVCHSPHASDDPKFFRNKQAQVCRSCHNDTFAGYVDKLYSHPATESCGDCHAVHGSSQMAMLKGDGIQVCSICHKTQGDFTHPVGEGIYDPRNGLQMSCVTCHYPHGTDYKYNLKLSGEKDLCVQCHMGY